MAFSCYLVERFDTTHENIFFQEFALTLSKQFDTELGEHVLVGNLSCQGHQLDALFIARGKVIVLDFKDYEGTLTLSENNPWKLKTKEGFVYVAGGARCRNPFQQVNAYRFALMNFITNNQDEVIDINHDNINWSHINCIVLFQRQIIFDKKEVPSKTARYFHIADKGSINDLLTQIFSKDIELSNNEINKILKLLNITADNLYNPLHQISKQDFTTSKVDLNKLLIVQQFLRKHVPGSRYKNILDYYKTVLAVERHREPNLEKTYQLPSEKPDNAKSTIINLTKIPKFMDDWQKNIKDKFPKNLFVAINFDLNGKTEPLLNTVLIHSDIQDISNIEINLNNFNIYSKILENYKLPEDIIEDLTFETDKAEILQEKVSIISTILSTPVKQLGSFTIGLSSESMYTAQLLSELRQLANREVDGIMNPLFNNFLQNVSVPSVEIPSIKRSIQITPLNKNQQRAIDLSFSQPLTVITGPPGTGKSQVVLNIIANAIINGQSVLFASKNNMAIDSVKDRFDKTLNFPFLIRFGSQDSLRTVMKPTINSFLNQRIANNYTNTEADFNTKIEEITNDKQQILTLQSKLERIPILEAQFISQKKELEDINVQQKKWFDCIDIQHRKLFIDQKLSFSFSLNDVNLQLKKLHSYTGLFGGLSFLFKKSKMIKYVKEVNENQPLPIQELINKQSPWADPSKRILISLTENLGRLSLLRKEQIHIQSQNNKFEENKKVSLQKVIETEEQLNSLISKVKEMEAEIEFIESSFSRKGLDCINYYIQSKLSTINIAEVQAYLNEIPANQIWKEDDISRFGHINEAFLKNFPAVCATNLSIKNSFALQPGLFDLLIIDEASQCDIASALPMMFRAKRSVVIGDPLQLRHITSIKLYEDDYIKERLNIGFGKIGYVPDSLFSYGYNIANLSKSDGVFLDEHYRCHPDIISFSSAYFYNPELGQSLTIRTNENDFKFQPKGVTWLNVTGSSANDNNVNPIEVSRCIEIAVSLHKKYPTAAIGIITPFAGQAKALKAMLPIEFKDHIQAETVHRFQGDEKDIVIFSTVITDNSPSSKIKFLTSNKELINVAVTRARSSLIVVGNYDYCSKLSVDKSPPPITSLAKYINSKERVVNSLFK